MSVVTYPLARVVVIPIGIGHYRDPPPAQQRLGRARFDDLKSVESDLARLSALFGSQRYREAGFSVLPTVSGTQGEVADRLTEVAEDLATQPGSTVLLYWTGHGETPGGGELRLATVESYRPMNAGDGLPPAELVNKLVACGAKALCFVLDVCQAGAAEGTVAATAAKRFQEQPPAENRFPGMAVLFSAQPFEPAEEGLLVDVLERLLREGPSLDARAVIAEEGWGGFRNNRLLTMGELVDVLQVEFDLLKAHKPSVQSPAGAQVGRSFGLFPNPLFQADGLPVSVETARRRWLRQQDVDTHFLPKARGLEPGEDGWFFSGRASVSRHIIEWLTAHGEAVPQNLYVLTGDGGTGKSAIIGRIVALSDPGFRDAARRAGWNEAADILLGTEPPIGQIDAALHLRNLTADAVTVAIAGLLAIPRPDVGRGLAAFVDDVPVRLAGAPRPILLIVDALDEASEPARIAEQLLRPLATKGWRILVGTRRSAVHRGATNLLDALGPAYVRNLDSEPASEPDIAHYVIERLGRTPDSPYAALPEEHVAVIARRVAAKASGRFLYARIIADGLLRRGECDLARLDDELGENVGDAFARDLATLDEGFRGAFGRTVPGATPLLEALAWAEGEGLPLRDGLWPTIATAIAARDDPYSEVHVQWILREAGRYVLESSDGEQAVYRLFHQALNDHFRTGDDAQAVSRRIGSSLWAEIERDTRSDFNAWDLANPYLVQHLPAHLAHGEPSRLEELCTNAWYLRRAFGMLGADGLASLLARAHQDHTTFAIGAVAKSVRRARVALSRDPTQLATQLYARLGVEMDPHPALRRLTDSLQRIAPPVWLRSTVATLGWRADLQTMQTFGAKVRALAFGHVEDAPVIAVGAGAEVTLWDPRSGQTGSRVISNEGLRVTGLALGTIGGREVIAVAAGYDSQLAIRDLRTGALIGEPMAGSIGTLAVGRAGGRDMVAIAQGEMMWARSLGNSAPVVELQRDAVAIGRWGTALAAVERDGAGYQVVNLDTGQRVGPVIGASADTKLVAIGEWQHLLILCLASRTGEVTLRCVGPSRELTSRRDVSWVDLPKDPAIRINFPVRTLVIGEVEGELIVAAGNDADVEGGYVAVRQPLELESSSLPLAQSLQTKRVLGIGRADAKVLGAGYQPHRRKNRLPVLLVEDVGAVDPITSEVIARDRDSGVGIELLSGAWEVPITVAEPTPPRRGHSLTLRRDRPLQWPVTSEAWGVIDGRLLQVRGSYLGVLWVVDAVRKKNAIRGPFCKISSKVTVLIGVKAARSKADPVSGVALGTWQGRGVVAMAHTGRATAFDLETEAPLGSPETGKSEIEVVALGEFDGRPILATGSAGGAVTIWKGPSMQRLASVTLDDGVTGVWLGGGTIVVRTSDYRFHVFGIVISDEGVRTFV